MIIEKTIVNEVPQRNKQAWDALYRDTEGSVWGADPIPFVEEFLTDLKDVIGQESRLLDAAAGEGRHVPVLSLTNGEIHACDSSEHALEKMRVNHGHVHLAHCDLGGLPFVDDHFDFISLIDTIETLPDPTEALQEMYRVMKRGGYLLCNIPGVEDQISSVSMNPVFGEEKETYFYDDQYYFRFYQEQDAIDLLESCGFRVLRNELRSWEEDAHPGFREYRHEHTSRVFLVGKD